MSTTVNLDKTLDDIIGSSKPRGTRRRSRPAKTAGGVAKKASAGAKKDVSKIKDTGAKKSRHQQQKKVSVDDPFYQAVKVTVSNFPVDITESKLKEFLSKDIGVVKSCEGVYARNGKPTGKFTVEFRDEGKALATFNKLNGMPMDGGAKILAVEIHTDPTRKSLASRLGGLTKDVKKEQPAKKQPQKQKKPRKKAPAAATKRVPKSAEELDAEMDDYINQKDDAITV